MNLGNMSEYILFWGWGWEGDYVSPTFLALFFLWLGLVFW